MMPSSPSENAGLDQINGVEIDENSLIFPYERLKVVADDPVTTGIDVTKREVPSPVFIYRQFNLLNKLSKAYLLHVSLLNSLPVLKKPPSQVSENCRHGCHE